MIYESIFEKLGLTRHEAELYLILLKLGPSPTGKIIQKSGFQSSVVYHLLNALIEKGVVSFSSERRKKIFSASDPDVFESLLSRKQEELDTVRKDFKALTEELASYKKENTEEQTVTVFRGFKGVQTIMDDVLRNARHYDLYSTLNTFSRAMPKYREYVRQTRIARKVHQRVIIASDEHIPNRPYQKKKYISETFASPVGLMLYHDKVVIFVWDADPPISIVLEGKKVSVAFKAMYETMWKQAKS